MEKNLAYMDWFSSPLFHNFWSDSKEKESQSFIDQLIKHIHPKRGSRILDSACGQGINSIHLTSLGFDVTGVDMSTSNIDWALTREQNNPEFYQHDLRLPFWGNYFHTVLNLSEGFGFYRTRREHEAAFRTIASSLQPGGKFVIDYPNTHHLENRLAEQSFTHKHNEILYQFDLSQNETHFLHTITITSPGTNEPVAFAFERAKLSVGDFTEMLAFQKLQVKEVFGDYSLGEYHLSETPRLVVVAEKQ
ncbi:class I SAM-dependent methyltransferase [Terrimonas sp. NA20]|uniref:Class I SAM-dependent methyltransferase n=1 Tax=Terrimonas ginsenosidimutans TaxID=2908004 RepID=A0ABS9KX40_9BACT|nr:class I SAM-dependent methyltransferase [Terrimonas ginsenosidimutans]MCG2616878.1 class I SAM-dependent methyltransferase [Terrimonas ginsenosidimutans]